MTSLRTKIAVMPHTWGHTMWYPDAHPGNMELCMEICMLWEFLVIVIAMRPHHSEHSHLMPCTYMPPPPHAFTVSSQDDWVIMAITVEVDSLSNGAIIWYTGFLRSN